MLGPKGILKTLILYVQTLKIPPLFKQVGFPIQLCIFEALRYWHQPLSVLVACFSAKHTSHQLGLTVTWLCSGFH